MGIYDRLDAAALEVAGATASAGDEKVADLLDPLWVSGRRLRQVYIGAASANSDAARMRGVMDVRMAAEEYVMVARAAKDGFVAIHKIAAERLAELEAEMVPFAAEQNIAGSTHVAEYQNGSDRVVVTDYDKARRSAPAEFWRFKDPEPDKVKLAAAMRAGRKFEGIGWDEGPPSLRIKKLETKKDGDHE